MLPSHSALKQLLWESLTDNVINTSNKIPELWIFAEFFLIEGYVQSALRKKLFIAPFVEYFKILLWKSLTDSVYQYLKQNAKVLQVLPNFFR